MTPLRALCVSVVLLFAAGCGATSTTSQSPTTPSAPTTAAPSAATTAPSAPTNTASSANFVSVSGDRSGSLTNVQPLCMNQYAGVETTGMLNGHAYRLSVIDPATTESDPVRATLYEYPTTATGTEPVSAQWETTDSGGTSGYDYLHGAKFTGTLQPSSTNAGDATSSVHVTAAISC